MFIITNYPRSGTSYRKYSYFLLVNFAHFHYEKNPYNYIKQDFFIIENYVFYSPGHAFLFIRDFNARANYKNSFIWGRLQRT